MAEENKLPPYEYRYYERLDKHPVSIEEIKSQRKAFSDILSKSDGSRISQIIALVKAFMWLGYMIASWFIYKKRIDEERLAGKQRALIVENRADRDEMATLGEQLENL